METTKAMNKTLLKTFNPFTAEKTGDMLHTTENKALTELMNEMKPFWQEAANDLLQPRPEAVAQLLRRSNEMSVR
jgi:hypothetical protein